MALSLLSNPLIRVTDSSIRRLYVLSYTVVEFFQASRTRKRFDLSVVMFFVDKLVIIAVINKRRVLLVRGKVI